MPVKKNIGIFFGGKSPEHEVSIETFYITLDNLNKDKFNPIPIYVTKKNEFIYSPAFITPSWLDSPEEVLREGLSLLKLPHDGNFAFGSVGSSAATTVFQLNVALPCFHGGSGEGGGFQGFCDLMNIACVGSDVYSSAASLDKVIMKQILLYNDIPTPKFFWSTKDVWKQTPQQIVNSIKSHLTFPIFVKPAICGSSIGISKVHNESDLNVAIEDALLYDVKFIAEEGIEHIKEISVAVLLHRNDYITSVSELCTTSSTFLNYNDKYNSLNNRGGKMKIEVPANLPSTIQTKVNTLAIEVFRLLDCRGVARIDFIWDQQNDHLLVLELNSIPLHFSSYLWEPSVLEMTDVVTAMIESSVIHKKEKDSLRYSVEPTEF